MSNVEKGQVMTANRLRDGDAVFLTRAGIWSEKIDDAALDDGYYLADISFLFKHLMQHLFVYFRNPICLL